MCGCYCCCCCFESQFFSVFIENYLILSHRFCGYELQFWIIFWKIKCLFMHSCVFLFTVVKNLNWKTVFLDSWLYVCALMTLFGCIWVDAMLFISFFSLLFHTMLTFIIYCNYVNLVAVIIIHAYTQNCLIFLKDINSFDAHKWRSYKWRSLAPFRLNMQILSFNSPAE